MKTTNIQNSIAALPIKHLVLAISSILLLSACNSGSTGGSAAAGSVQGSVLEGTASATCSGVATWNSATAYALAGT